MTFEKLQHSIIKNSNRHIFSRFRTHIRIWASIVYLGFSFFDYLYAPDLFKEWLTLRIAAIIAANLIFYITLKSKALRRNMSIPALITIWVYCWPIVYMVYESGAVTSMYTTGLILIGTTGVQVFRLREKVAFWGLMVSFLPAIIMFFFTSTGDNFKLAILQSGFLLGMIILSIIYGNSESQVDRWWQKFKYLADSEIERLRKTEILKNHFPKIIRDAFEKNPDAIYGKRVLPNAVVGFADIVSSSQISNVVPIGIDWDLKEKFLEAATRRAIESEMVVLTHLGDGFLFLANFNESSQWYYNLVSFYEALVGDFKYIIEELKINDISIQTGVKFGVSSGPVMVGFLGTNQSYFTAIGSDVNLASRLCSLAKTDQIVFSSRVWHSIKPLISGWPFTVESYDGIKGFEYQISAVHLSPRLSGKNSLICSECGKTMSLIKTPEGFLDYRCANGHNSPSKAQISSKKSAA